MRQQRQQTTTPAVAAAYRHYHNSSNQNHTTPLIQTIPLIQDIIVVMVMRAMSEDYKGMSREAEDAYNKRQNEPLFKTAKSMIPMEQVKQHFENLLCGHHKRTGCNLLTRDVSFYACIWHQAMNATGTDFFMYYRLFTDNDLERMTAAQHKALEDRYHYEMRWLDNFPRGAYP